jgi:ATP-dependent Zn protease
MTRVACHEAGHVVASEALRPGSVTFSCIHEPENGSRGFTAYAVESESVDDVRREATCSLAGAAALELQFGVMELGSGGDGGDFQSAQETLRVLIEQSGCRGFALLEAFHEESERRLSDMEQVLAAELERHYAEAKRVLAANRAFLEAVTAELLKRGLLSADEIRRIRDACAEKAG